MTDATIQRIADRITDKVIELTMNGTAMRRDDLHAMVTQALLARIPVDEASDSHTEWAFDRLRTIATTAEPFDQIQACEAIVRSTGALLEAVNR